MFGKNSVLTTSNGSNACNGAWSIASDSSSDDSSNDGLSQVSAPARPLAKNIHRMFSLRLVGFEPKRRSLIAERLYSNVKSFLI